MQISREMTGRSLLTTCRKRNVTGRSRPSTSQVLYSNLSITYYNGNPTIVIYQSHITIVTRQSVFFLT